MITKKGRLILLPPIGQSSGHPPLAFVNFCKTTFITYKIKKYGGMGRQRTCLELSPYEFMLKNQSGVCAICEKKCSSGRALAIDHDHSTNKVRGLLCNRCNRGLGMFMDDPKLLSTAALYLKKYGKS